MAQWAVKVYPAKNKSWTWHTEVVEAPNQSSAVSAVQRHFPDEYAYEKATLVEELKKHNKQFVGRAPLSDSTRVDAEMADVYKLEVFKGGTWKATHGATHSDELTSATSALPTGTKYRITKNGSVLVSTERRADSEDKDWTESRLERLEKDEARLREEAPDAEREEIREIYQEMSNIAREKKHLGKVVDRAKRRAADAESDDDEDKRADANPRLAACMDAVDKIARRLDSLEKDCRMDAPVSEAQRRAMRAAASGNSTEGIPAKVGKEFSEKDPGGKLPEKKADDRPGESRGDGDADDWRAIERLSREAKRAVERQNHGRFEGDTFIPDESYVEKSTRERYGINPTTRQVARMRDEIVRTAQSNYFYQVQNATTGYYKSAGRSPW